MSFPTLPRKETPVVYDTAFPATPSNRGPMGPTGMDGEDGEDGLALPGPRGADGLSIQGPAGMDGEDGADGVGFPGPRGADGLSIQGPPGNDGEDADFYPYIAPRVSERDSWDVYIIKGVDDALANANLADDSELFAFIRLGEVWRFEIEVLYTSSATADYQCNVRLDAGTAVWWSRYIGTDDAANAILVSTGVRNSGANITAIVAGGGTVTVLRHIFIEGVVSNVSSDANVRFRAAAAVAPAGASCKTKAGTILKMRRIA